MFASMCEAGWPSQFRQLAHPSFEKAPLRLLLSETEGPFVRGSRLRCSPGSAAEIGPRGMREMIVRQISSR